jgi:hypothetical protein
MSLLFDLLRGQIYVPFSRRVFPFGLLEGVLQQQESLDQGPIGGIHHDWVFFSM